MNYRHYKGTRKSFQELSPELQLYALNSFWAIHIAYFHRGRGKGTIHNRINDRYIKKTASSLSLVKQVMSCPIKRLKSFDANLVEFTEQGEYLNMYLELD
jgi:hypothetical protein